MHLLEKTFRPLAPLVFVFAPQAFALTLTWDECVSRTAANNPDIAVALATVKSDEALVLGAWSGFLPQVSLNGGYSQTGQNGGPAATLGNGATSLPSTGGATTQFSEAITANQSLFNGFSDLGKIRQARANRDAAQANLAIVKAQVSSNLKTAFAELLFEQQSVELNAGILKRQQNNLRMVSLRYAGGNENRGNQLYQAASVSQAQYQYDHSKRQVRNGARQLLALIGQPELRDVQVVGELTARVPAAPPDMNQLVQNNPTHVQAVATKVSAEAAVEISNGSWYPNINLTGSAGKNGVNYPPDTSRWSVGVVLTFPIFPGTSTISAVESAYALEHQADFALTSADFKLMAGLEAALASLEDAVDQVKVAQDFATGAKARSVIADGKYNTGLMTFEDWSVIDTDYVTRQQNLLINQRNAMQAEASWENAEGVGAIK